MNEVTILHAVGKLTFGGNLRQFREEIGQLLHVGITKILVDVAEVTEMDGSGVGELLTAYATVSSTGGEIKLLNLGKRPRKRPHKIILSAVFETFEDETSAMRSYSSPEPSNPHPLKERKQGASSVR